MFVQELFILVLIISVILSVISIVFVYSIVDICYEEKKAKKIEYFIEENSSVFYGYIMEEKELPRALISDSAFKIIAMEEVLSKYAAFTEVRVYAERHLSSYYKELLKSKKWRIRMNTLSKITAFKMASTADEIIYMINSKKKYSKEEYFQMYNALVMFGHQDLIPHLLEPKVEFNELEYKKLLFMTKQGQFEALLLHYDRFPTVLKACFIELIGIKNINKFVPFLEEKLSGDNLEIRVRALKALSQIVYTETPEIYYPFVDSEHWEERMMVAKMLAYIDTDMAVSSLHLLLKDPIFWVRSQAAESIIMIKNGKQILESVIESNQDKFAIDMAKEILGRG